MTGWDISGLRAALAAGVDGEVRLDAGSGACVTDGSLLRRLGPGLRQDRRHVRRPEVLTYDGQRVEGAHGAFDDTAHARSWRETLARHPAATALGASAAYRAPYAASATSPSRLPKVAVCDCS